MSPPLAVILLAHGSADPRWGEPIRALETALGQAAPDLIVLRASLRGGDSLEQALAGCRERGAVRVLVAPIFFSAGGHVLRDLPELVARAAAAHGGLQVRCAAALGEQPEVVLALARACLRLIAED